MVKEVGKVYHAQISLKPCMYNILYIYIHVEHYSRLDGLAFRDVSLFSEKLRKCLKFVKVWKNPSHHFSVSHSFNPALTYHWFGWTLGFLLVKKKVGRLSQNSPDSGRLVIFTTCPQHSTIPLGLEWRKQQCRDSKFLVKSNNIYICIYVNVCIVPLLIPDVSLGGKPVTSVTYYWKGTMWCGAPLAGRAALTWKVLVAVHPANLWNNMCQGVFRWAQGQNHLEFFHVFTTITGDDEMMHHFKIAWEYWVLSWQQQVTWLPYVKISPTLLLK